MHLRDRPCPRKRIACRSDGLSRSRAAVRKGSFVSDCLASEPAGKSGFSAFEHDACRSFVPTPALLRNLLLIAENHAGALNSKYHREHGEQYREHKLQAVGQRECAAGDGQELRLHGKHERS